MRNGAFESALDTITGNTANSSFIRVISSYFSLFLSQFPSFVALLNNLIPIVFGGAVPSDF
jgi:hypothetical protein